MKRWLTGIVAGVVCVVVLTGCGSSSNQDLELAAYIIGTWLLENVVIDGQTVAVSVDSRLSIKEDGTYTETTDGAEVDSGSWRLSEGDLAFVSAVSDVTDIDLFDSGELSREEAMELFGIYNVHIVGAGFALTPLSSVLPGTPSEYQYVPTRVVHPRYYAPE